MRLTIIFFFNFLSVGLVAQFTSWKTANENSVISYSAAHILHPWEGINKNILGVAVVDSVNNTINKMAILVYVKDFDSNNSSRDAHALEVLEALQFPQVRFFSEKISVNNEQVNLEGTLDFHGEKAPLEIVGKVNWFDKKLELSGTGSGTTCDVITSVGTIDICSKLVLIKPIKKPNKANVKATNTNKKIINNGYIT